MISIFILSKPLFAAASYDSIKSSKECILPSILSSSSLTDCRPKLNLLTPFSLYIPSLSSSMVPGLHSIVISQSSLRLKLLYIAPSTFISSPASIIDGVPPPKKMLSTSYSPASFGAPEFIWVHNALRYCFLTCSSAGAEKKSQYIHLDLQKGICMYIPNFLFAI